MILRNVYWGTPEREFQTTVPIENLKWEYVCERVGQHCQNGTGGENVKKKKKKFRDPSRNTSGLDLLEEFPTPILFFLSHVSNQFHQIRCQFLNYISEPFDRNAPTVCPLSLF